MPVESGLGGYTNTQGLLRLEYVPSARAGFEARFWQSSPNRQSVIAGEDTISAPRHGRRRDLTARTYFAGANGMGPRADLLLSRTEWVDEIIPGDSTPEITEIRDALGADVEDAGLLGAHEPFVGAAGVRVAAEVVEVEAQRAEYSPSGAALWAPLGEDSALFVYAHRTGASRGEFTVIDERFLAGVTVRTVEYTSLPTRDRFACNDFTFEVWGPAPSGSGSVMLSRRPIAVYTTQLLDVVTTAGVLYIVAVGLLIVYGVLLVVVVLFLPEGAYPRLARALGRRARA